MVSGDTLREAVARAMSGDPEAAEIAARLSPAQRRALLWLPARGSGPSGKDSPWALQNIARMGLCGADLHECWWRATPLGLRVRAVIAAEAAGP